MVITVHSLIKKGHLSNRSFISAYTVKPTFDLVMAKILKGFPRALAHMWCVSSSKRRRLQRTKKWALKFLYAAFSSSSCDARGAVSVGVWKCTVCQARALSKIDLNKALKTA